MKLGDCTRRRSVLLIFSFALLVGVTRCLHAQPATGVYRELFTGFNRANSPLWQLTNDTRFLNGTPTSTNIFTSFSTEQNMGEDYGQRVRGFITAPTTGNYAFWISSDEVGQLFLGTNESPASKRLLAICDPRAQPANYTTHAGQQSADIPLVAGQRYYIEALHAEANLIDHLSVQWRLPGGAMETPIPGSRLVYEIPPLITAQLTNVTVEEGRPAVFVSDVANFLPQSYRWQRNGADVLVGTNRNYVLSAAAMTDHGALFRATITNRFGATNTAEVSLTVLRDTNAPVVVRVAVGNETNLFINFSEPMQPVSALNGQNYRIGGATVLSAAFGDDPRTVILRTSPLVFDFGSSVSISNLFDRASIPNALAAANLPFNIVQQFNPQDVGSPALAGEVTPVSGRSEVSGAGSGIGGTSDQFQFGWQAHYGDFDFRARIHSLDFTDLWARAGLMARENFDASSRFAAVFATPTLAGTSFQARLAAGGLAIAAGQHPVNYPDTWLRLRRTNDQFIGFASMDGNNWTQLGTATIAMSNRVYLGVAVTSQKTNQLATAVFDDFLPTPSGGTIDVIIPTTEPLGPSSRKTGLVISEIMYHPRDVYAGTNKLELEHVELFNSNPYYEDISGYRIAGDIDYTFPPGTVLQGGSFLVIARVPADVQSFYGLSGVFGPFTNNLPNDAGRVRLRNDSGTILLEVNYSSRFPWPVAADGLGHSLVLARPSYGEDQRAAWAASDAIDGSPGRLESFGADALRPVVINEFLAHAPATAAHFIELYNRSAQPISIGGAWLGDSANTNKFQIPIPTVIPARGFVWFDQSQLGFSFNASGGRIFFVNGSDTRVIDAISFEGQANGVSSGRFPDGAPTLQQLLTQTPGTSNGPPAVHEIVINEIMYNPISGNGDDEFVELHNTATYPVDLSGWRFTDGIDFTFASNTVIAAGGYLAVAKNVARLRSNYANLNSTNTVGNFDGNLRNSGERVALSRPESVINYTNNTTSTTFVLVDEVEFGTGGNWGRWSDGGGSSLELMDPLADNRLAPNWADSDETAKAPWTNIEFTGATDNGLDAANALFVTLLEEGECLIDNVEAFVAPAGANQVPNSTFETGTNSWLFRGNHQRSSPNTNEGFGGSARSLHLRASSRGDIGANKAFINLSSTLSGNVTLRAKARWLRGWPEVLLRLRGGYLEATDRLIVPANLGTPGAPNSRLVPNAGPAITDVQHTPAVPAANEPVVVTARVSDPDGIGVIALKYRIDPSASLATNLMNDAGINGDAAAGDGIFSATIPGRPADALVAFFIEAIDTASIPVTARFPALKADNGVLPECQIHFGSPTPASSFGTYRFWITQSSITNWSTREVLSNERIPGTFVYGNHRVIYGAGARYSGSAAHQDQGGPDYSPVGTPNNYALDMPKDDLLLGTDNFNKIHGAGNNHHDDNTLVRETTAYWMARRLGLPENHKRYVQMFINGARRGPLMEDTQVPNNDVIEAVFPDDAEGDLFKISVWYEFGPTPAVVLPTPASAEASLRNFTTTGGVKKRARYRQVWQGRAIHGTANDYTNVFTLVDVANIPSGPHFVQNMSELVDMENWMRTFALEHAIGNWDSFGYRNQQNMFAYKPERGPWSLLIWDINIIFGGGTRGTPVAVTDDLFERDAATDPPMDVIYNTPAFRRIYWQALRDIVNGPLNNVNADLVLDAKSAAFSQSGVFVTPPDMIKTWISLRRAYILSQLAANDAAGFSVNGPGSFSTGTNFIAISGAAQFNVKTIEINGVAWPITWTSVTNWTLRLPLNVANNVLTILGYDAQGNLVAGASNQINVTYTGPVPQPEDFVVINEIMYNPLAPNAEYVELFNTSSNVAFDLSGWRFNGLGFTFPPGSFITNRQFLVLAANRAAFAAAYGATVPVFGEYAGRLEGNDETLTLLKPGASSSVEIVVDRVRYESSAPWPTNANGTGSSLQLIDPNQENARVGNWFSSFVPAVYTPEISTPARTNDGWRFVSISGSVANGIGGGQMRLIIHLGTELGSAIIDDVSLVPGTNAAVGANYVRNGDFESSPLLEDPALTNSWNVGTNYTNTTIISSLTHGGGGALRLAASSFGNAFPRLIAQNLSPAPPANSTNTLSFWYWATNSSTNLTVRLVNSSALATTTNMNIFFVPSNYVPPVLISAASNSLSPGTANQNVSNQPAFPPLWVNEVQAENISGILDNNGQREPWVEIFNTSPNTVSLDGLYLAPNYTNLTGWAFPAGSSIGPMQFLLVFCDGQPGQSAAAEHHTSFRLPPSAGSIALSRLHNNEPQVLDYVNYFNLASDRSYGSFPDGQPFDRQEFFHVTPRGTNDGRLVLPVVWINEWMADNTSASGIADPADGHYEDWFELYNPGSTAVDLGGYFLTDNLTNKFQFEVPGNGHYVVAPGGYLLVWADSETGQNSTNRGDLHVSFNLRAAGEAIGLFAADGTQIDAVTFGQQTNSVSQGRNPDGGTNIIALAMPTPRTSNAGAAVRPAVAITVAPGNITLTFTTQPGARYRVQYKDNLAAPAWADLSGDITAASALSTKSDTNNGAQRFYRISVVP